MTIGEQSGTLLLRLSEDTLVFNSEFLTRLNPKFGAAQPQTVIGANDTGTVINFDDGFYAYRGELTNDTALDLNCVSGDSVFHASYSVDLDEIPSIPAQMVLPNTTASTSAWHQKVPSFLGYTVLSDGTVILPLENLSQHATQSVIKRQGVDVERLIFVAVKMLDSGYCHSVSRGYLMLYPNQVGQSPHPQWCQLTLTFKDVTSSQMFDVSVCLDPSYFSTLLISRPSQPLSASSISQTTLIPSTSSELSPILFVDEVYCLDSRQFLEPQNDGSFSVQDGNPLLKTASYVYSICDGVEHVATGIAVLNRPS